MPQRCHAPTFRCRSSGRRDTSQRLLLPSYDGGGPRYFHADIDELEFDAATKSLQDAVNDVLGETQRTYRVGDTLPFP